ncbi:MAG: hypothetical protein LC134_04815, partial [Chitinophagales bacterium]|nr:hypothetical protein [Chitinophagales bacterium]
MLLLCFAYLAGSSQTTITIGSGTSTQRYPLGHLWGYERTASLYTTSEMASVAGNNITSIGWYATSTGNACPTKIYLATTATAPLTAVTWANMITGATLVFDGTLTPSPANAWFSVTLTTPFTYSGDNLLVLVETNYGGTGGGTYPNLQYTTTSANYQETWTADNAPPTGTGSATTSRTNIQITHVSNAPCSGMPSAGTAEAPVTIQ